jgi:phosphoglycerol transferase MdoB-like AlkP superfamily enzyme
VTELDLVRFHIPLLVLGDGIRERFGPRRSVVGTQVDVVPTIMGLLGGAYTHHCWGRDLLALPPGDPGQGVIKPSGSDQSVAILRGDRILIKPEDGPERMYRYELAPQLRAELLDDAATQQQLYRQLKAYLQTATQALLTNSAGHGDQLPQHTVKREVSAQP